MLQTACREVACPGPPLVREAVYGCDKTSVNGRAEGALGAWTTAAWRMLFEIAYLDFKPRYWPDTKS